MSKRSSKFISRFFTVISLVAMLLVAVLPVVSFAQDAGAKTTVSVNTTPGSTENLRYFKEDTYYDMSEKVAPMTIEFELTGCGSIPGANPGGVIVGNYSEGASTYVNVEVVEWGLLRVRGKFNSGSEWIANFYSSESADVRLNGVHHYTIVINSGWGGVSLYVDGVHKATRYPASLTLPKASDYTHPFRIGGDYREGNTNYFKGLVYSVAMYSDVRTAAEIKTDMQRVKNWKSGDGLVAAYDITRMGEAALRDYSESGNKLVYVNGSGIQVENFGKYEIDQSLSGIETFEAWVYMPRAFDAKAIGGTIIGNYRSYNGARVMLEVYLAGNPRLSYTNANGTTSYHRFTDVDLRTGTWQHLTVVHDVATGEARCYVNGELKQTVVENVVAYSGSAFDQKFLVGRDTALRYAEGDGEYWENRNDKYFKGFIKELRLYSDVRSDSEIAADYAGALDSSELLLAYRIDPEDAYTDLQDLSGNGYNANYKQLLWEKEYVELADDTYAYSFAIVGDTQTVTDQNPEKLKEIYEWIVSNKDAKNIQYVIGLGDITELGVDVGHKNYTEASSNNQWTAAKEAITMMDGILPYSLIRGDGHDGIEMFNKYFGTHEGYLSNVSGYYEEGRIDNVYHTFKIGEVDYMILCLDHGTKDDVLVWANEVVAAHPDHRVIVTTHQYLQSDGTLSESWESGNATAYDPNNNAADGLWDKFLSKHPNISMVICGHSDTNGVLVTKQTGDHGNEVTSILINPQSMDAEYYHGSKGMVAMLYFSADGQTVQVEYYSTIKDTYYPSDDFTVSYSTESHSYTETVTPPTCTESGYTDHECAVCGYGYVTDHTDALGHTEVDLEAKAPTCTENGLTAGKKCSACDHVFVHQTDIIAEGHKEETLDGFAPTCTENGLTDGKKCTVCDTVTVPQIEMIAPGHNYNAVVTAPDCENGGYTTYTCTVCGDTYTGDETAALGHNYNAVVTAPDCENGGYTTYTCTVCGDDYIGDETAALGHNYNTVVTAPDCENGGYTTYTCTVCGDDYIGDETAALGHNYNTVVTAPDCENGGYTTYTCTVCGDDYIGDETAALGHNYNDGVVTTVPTCTKTGVKTYTCQNDASHTYTEEIAALGHTDETVAGKAPTCTEIGLTEGIKCAICNEMLTYQVEIPALGHTDATPTDYICDVCGADLCTDHVEEIISGKAPTCTETGLTDGKQCAICGDVLETQQIIPALGHNYNAAVTEPDCVNGGYTTHTCSVCADSYTDSETAALGHNYNAAVTEPDCVNGGYTTHTCSVCADSYIDSETAALGHEWLDATTEAPKTCDKCGATEGEKLPEPMPEPTPDDDVDEEKDHSKCEPENFFEQIILMLINFLRTLMGMPEYCFCGEELN